MIAIKKGENPDTFTFFYGFDFQKTRTNQISEKKKHFGVSFSFRKLILMFAIKNPKKIDVAFFQKTVALLRSSNLI